MFKFQTESIYLKSPILICRLSQHFIQFLGLLQSFTHKLTGYWCLILDKIQELSLFLEIIKYSNVKTFRKHVSMT